MEVVRRGYVPKDAIEFGPKATKKLNAAAQDLEIGRASCRERV